MYKVEQICRIKSEGRDLYSVNTRSMVYKKHREIETRLHISMRFLFSYNKIPQKGLVVSYKGVSYKPYCV